MAFQLEGVGGNALITWPLAEELFSADFLINNLSMNILRKERKCYPIVTKLTTVKDGKKRIHRAYD